MATAGMALLIAFAAGLVLNPLAGAVCRRTGIVDLPDGYRKVHTRPTPLSGGYAILLSLFAPILALRLFDQDGILNALSAEQPRLRVVLAASLIVFFMGAVDDKRDLTPRIKLICQVAAAIVVYLGGVGMTAVSNPIGSGKISLGLLSFPATVLWLLICMNIINLIDGVDGLAGGVALFACVTMGLVSLSKGHTSGAFLCACLSGAILGFLVFNFHPAKVFLGDAGSQTIGFLIGAISLLGSTKAGTAVALVVPIIALGLPAFDTALAILRRYARRIPVVAADRRHIHHILLERGLSPKGVVLILYSVCIALGGAALLLTAGNSRMALGLLSLIGIVAFVFIRVCAVVNIDDIRARLLQDLGSGQKRNKAAVAVEKAIDQMQRLDTDDDLWNAACQAFAVLGFSEARCRLEWEDQPRELWWKAEKADLANAKDRCSLSLKLVGSNAGLGELELRRTCAESVNSCGLILARRLRDSLSERLATLAGPQPQQEQTGTPTDKDLD